MSISDQVKLLLSVQRAFLGEITPNIRSIVCSWQNTSIEVLVYIDGLITQNQYEDLNCVETEIIADFEPDISVSLKVIQVDMPNKFSIDDAEILVYERKE